MTALQRKEKVNAQMRFHGLLLLIAPIVKGVFAVVNWVIYRTSKDATYFDPADFPWAAEIEAAYPEIREECLRALADINRVPNVNDIAEGAGKLAKGAEWKTFALMLYGVRADEHIARCPATWDAAQKMPGLNMCTYSILTPGSHLPKHKGIYAGILRFHMGILVPKSDACRIEVDGVPRTWEAGKAMIFDETHYHEVWNDTDELRVVLFCDFLRPMPAPLQWVTYALHWAMRQTTFPHDAVRNAQKPVPVPGSAPQDTLA